MKFTLTTLAALTALLLPSVSAHGFVKVLSVDGKDTKGNIPNGKEAPSAIRLIDDVSPVKGAANPELACGHGAKVASEVVNALPGSTVAFDWSGGNVGSTWPHDTGPMLTYLANCGSTTCDKFDATKAKWFKIDQVGRASSGKWAQSDLFNAKAVSVKLPKTLAAGNYLIRHEIIALHLSTTRGGAEFYPSCSQLKVGGKETGVPAANELVSLPGAYSDDDAGILVPDVFNAAAKYVFPGPPVAKIAALSTGDSENTPSSSSPATPTATSSAGVSKPTSGKSCSAFKKSKSKAKRAARARPHVRSRIMRDLHHSN